MDPCEVEKAEGSGHGRQRFIPSLAHHPDWRRLVKLPFFDRLRKCA